MKTFLSSLLLLASVAAIILPVHADEAKPTDDKPFGDWVLHCTKLSGGDKACALHQKVMSRETRLPVAALALARNNEGHELRLAAVLPLGPDIPAGVSGKVGSVLVPLTVQTCVRRGCIASTTVDDTLLEALRGADAFMVTFKMRIVADPTTIPVSLKGLDEGLKALETR